MRSIRTLSSDAATIASAVSESRLPSPTAASAGNRAHQGLGIDLGDRAAASALALSDSWAVTNSPSKRRASRSCPSCQCQTTPAMTEPSSNPTVVIRTQRRSAASSRCHNTGVTDRRWNRGLTERGTATCSVIRDAWACRPAPFNPSTNCAPFETKSAPPNSLPATLKHPS